jgi:hypothetical protein
MVTAAASVTSTLSCFFLPWQCARWEKPLGLLQLIERLYSFDQSSLTFFSEMYDLNDFM